jgi:LOB domain-containing protein 29
MHLSVSDHCEAAVTMSYEAQARLQDPIYGCVAHIFSLQQQVRGFPLVLVLRNESSTYMKVLVHIY